jgi:hypothetical protein
LAIPNWKSGGQAAGRTVTGPRLTPEQRSALELLASSPHGTNEELLVLSHGFTRRMVAGLVRRGLAAAHRKVVKAGGKAIEVTRRPIP